MDLAHIVAMLRLIGSMTGALFVVALLFLIILPTTEEGAVIYTLVLGINLVTSAGSIIGAHFLDKKDQELTKKEEQAALDRARVSKGNRKDKNTEADSQDK